MSLRSNAAHRVRTLERLMFDEPTDEECRQMLLDRDANDLPQSSESSIRNSDFVDLHLTQVDYSLWRAKVRAEHGSLSAIMDGVEIAFLNHRRLPGWLHRAALEYLAILGQPSSTEGSRKRRSAIAAERKKLIAQKRVEIVQYFVQESIGGTIASPGHSAVERHASVEHRVPVHWMRELVPQEVRRAIETGRIREYGKCRSVQSACELAHEILRGTWAQAAMETIRSDYYRSSRHLMKRYNIKALSNRQKQLVYFDVAFVLPSTLERLGVDVAR